MRSTTAPRSRRCSCWRSGSSRSHDVELVFTAREEIGCHGAQWYARRTDAEVVVALEVVPVAKEYGLDPGPSPVIIRGDSNGPLDDGISAELEDAALAAGCPVRQVVVSRYGSDASKVLAPAASPARACLGVATENTHGFEIANLDAIGACVDVLDRWLALSPSRRAAELRSALLAE